MRRVLPVGARTYLKTALARMIGGIGILKVTAAIIVRDDEIFVAKRGPGGRFAHLWEFPGGKIEPGETPEECLVREIREEFAIEIEVGGLFAESLHTFPGGAVFVKAFFCRWLRGELTPSEHEEWRWVKVAELASFEFAPADQPIAAKLVSEFAGFRPAGGK